MIITRTPLRISFVGGGSDQRAFHREEPGCVVSATIDKYVYLAVTRKYDGAVRVSYSHTENVAHAREVEHPLVRACLQLANVRQGIEIVSIADIPSGTGLGSSSSFTVGLLHALYALQGEFRPTDGLAHDACHVEIDLCHAPIGKQDQYAAAFGGLRCYTFHPDERVSAEALQVATSDLESHLLLFDTGIRRDANTILSAQTERMRDSRARADVRAVANLALTFRDALLTGNLHDCGQILDAAWRHKRNVGASTDAIDGWYHAAAQTGAWGGKVCGAGGGGFLLFMAPPERHEAIRRTLGLRHVPVTLAPHGTMVMCAESYSGSIYGVGCSPYKGIRLPPT